MHILTSLCESNWNIYTKKVYENGEICFFSMRQYFTKKLKKIHPLLFSILFWFLSIYHHMHPHKIKTHGLNLIVSLKQNTCRRKLIIFILLCFLFFLLFHISSLQPHFPCVPANHFLNSPTVSRNFFFQDFIFFFFYFLFLLFLFLFVFFYFSLFWEKKFST